MKISELQEEMKSKIERKEVITPTEWVEYGEQLNVMRADLDNAVFDLGQKVNQAKVLFIENGDSVAAAKLKVEAGDDYRKYMKLRAMQDRVTEDIRLAKLRARTAGDEFRGY